MPIIRRPFSKGNFLGGAFTGKPKKIIDSSTQKKILWTGGSPNHIKRILPDKWWAGEKNGSFSNGFLLFFSESFFGKKGYRRQKNHRSRVNIFIDRNSGTVILQKNGGKKTKNFVKNDQQVNRGFSAPTRSEGSAKSGIQAEFFQNGDKTVTLKII